MAFVDGENLTIQAQKVFEQKALSVAEGPRYQRNKFIWFAGQRADVSFSLFDQIVRDGARVRSLYYTSAVGSDELLEQTRASLWEIGFEPNVFRKTRQDQKAKGVDIALTKDMLAHAFRQNYDVAVLVAGDGDYVPLVEEVKRLGKRVCILFFGQFGLSPSLKLASDAFMDLTEYFVSDWKRAGQEPRS